MSAKVLVLIFEWWNDSLGDLRIAQLYQLCPIRSPIRRFALQSSLLRLACLTGRDHFTLLLHLQQQTRNKKTVIQSLFLLNSLGLCFLLMRTLQHLNDTRRWLLSAAAVPQEDSADTSSISHSQLGSDLRWANLPKQTSTWVFISGLGLGLVLGGGWWLTGVVV